MRKYIDAETLSTSEIATQVRETIKRKQKKRLRKDYEELQMAHIISQEKFTAERPADEEKNRLLQGEVEKLTAKLHVEKEKNMLLQEVLERTRVSHHEISSSGLKPMSSLSDSRPTFFSVSSTMK